MKRWRSVLLGLVISVATLGYAMYGTDFATFWQELVRGQYLYVLPTLALIVFGLLLRAVRWRALLNDRIELPHSFHVMNVGYFFNALLPLRLGEVARSYLATRLNPPISMFTALSSVVVERLTDLLAVVVLVALAVSIAPVTPEIVAGAQFAGAVSVAAMFVLAIFAWRRALAHRILNIALRLLPFLDRLNLRHITDRALDGILPLGSVRGVAVVLFWTGAAWFSSVVAGFVAMYVFYDNPNWESSLLMIAVASLAIALPAVPGSVGPFEAAVVLGLTVGGMVDPARGLPQERALAFAVVLHILNVGAYAFLGVIGLAQERVSLGEVIRTARQLASRKRETSPALPGAEKDSAPMSTITRL